MKQIKSFSVYLSIAFFSITSITLAQKERHTPLPVDSSYKIGKLSNGLTYYIRNNAEPRGKLELRLVVNVGSVIEDDDQQGLAHFVEHMAFNGTKHFKKNDLVSYLQSIGVQFGSDLNAYTGFDETVYILPIPTHNKKNVERGFEMLQDIAGGITFKAEDIGAERSIILEELRARKGPEDRMFNVSFPRVYPGAQHPNRIPGGKEEIIKTFKPEVIKRFYKDWYRPDLMAVVAVGDIDPAEMEQYIKKYFSKLQNPAKLRVKSENTIDRYDNTDALVITDKEATTYEFGIHYPFERTKPVATEADYRKYLIRSTAMGMLGWRLNEVSRRPNAPLAYNQSSFSSDVRGFEHFNSYAMIGNAGIKDAVAAVVQENERVRRFGFTRSEFDRMIARSAKWNETQYAERDKYTSGQYVEEYVRNFLEGEPIPDIEFEHSFKKNFYSNIRLEEINQAIAQLIPEISTNKLVVLKGPESGRFKMPSQEDLLNIVNDAAKKTLEPYMDEVVAPALMSSPPGGGNITTETNNKALGITELNLSNGVKVILKPTTFSNDQVMMTASRFGGQYSYGVNDRVNTVFTSSVIKRAGVGSFTRTDLDKVLAGKQAVVNAEIGQVTEDVTGFSTKEDLQTMLQLTYLRFTQPREDTASYASFIKEVKTGYDNLKQSPAMIFQDSVNHIRYGNHPWAPLRPKVENLQQLDEKRIYEIYRERFGNAYGFTFVFVGAFEIDSIKPLIAQYLGSLPAKPMDVKYTDVGLRPVKGPLKKEIKVGSDQKSVINLYWSGETTYTDNEAMAASALTEIMDIRLTEVLREQLGGIYSGGLYGGLNKFPYGSYNFQLYLPTGPEHVEKLIKASLTEIEKIKKEGPRKEDLEKVKEAWRQEYKTNIKDNGFWLETLMRRVNMGSDLNIILQYEERVNKLTTKEVQEVAKRYLDSNYVQIIMSPEK